LRVCLRGLSLLAAVLLVAGCAGHMAGREDTVETVLPVPPDQVRSALIAVLEADDYSVRTSDDERVVETGYRKQFDGPWSWLATSRFGVDRSKVNAVMSAEGADSTRLSLSVTHHAKDHVWSAWQETTPPPHRDAGLHLRALKVALGLL
jgi:hypothetical protein